MSLGSDSTHFYVLLLYHPFEHFRILGQLFLVCYISTLKLMNDKYRAIRKSLKLRIKKELQEKKKRNYIWLTKDWQWVMDLVRASLIRGVERVHYLWGYCQGRELKGERIEWAASGVRILIETYIPSLCGQVYIDHNPS